MFFTRLALLAAIIPPLVTALFTSPITAAPIVVTRTGCLHEPSNRMEGIWEPRSRLAGDVLTHGLTFAAKVEAQVHTLQRLAPREEVSHAPWAPRYGQVLRELVRDVCTVAVEPVVTACTVDPACVTSVKFHVLCLDPAELLLSAHSPKTPAILLAPTKLGCGTRSVCSQLAHTGPFEWCLQPLFLSLRTVLRTGFNGGV